MEIAAPCELSKHDSFLGGLLVRENLCPPNFPAKSQGHSFHYLPNPSNRVRWDEPTDNRLA